MLALPAIPHNEVVVVVPSGTTPAVRAKPAVKKTQTHIAPPALVQGRHEHALNDAPGKCAVEMLGGPEAQDRMIIIQTSESWEPIRLQGFTFDYGPLVAALCAAKSSEPKRRVDVVLDRGNTLTGPTKGQNPMVRQLLAAGVSVKLARGNKLSPVYQEAGRQNKLGSSCGSLHAKSVIIGRHVFVGSTNWTVASRANQECSVHLTLDESTAKEANAFFDVV